MDHNPIYISYLPRVTEAVQPSTLGAIIHSVRSGEWQEAVEAIRSAKDTEKQRLKQQRLPAFFPTVRLGEKNVLDEASIPTGIIQFDLDLKDNPMVDFAALSTVLGSLSETIYAFTSPSGGLKLGVQTDFHRHEDEGLESLKSRYKVAYGFALNWVQQRFPSPVSFDASVGNLKYACYLSDDPNAYFNPGANSLLLDADCHPVAATVVQPIYAPIHNDQVVELLRHIPGDLSYDARLPINIALFSEIGAEALPLLESHWTTDNRTKLKKDLQQQFRSVQQGTLSGNLGTLINAAKQHGWKPTTGEKRKSLRPQKTTETLPPLLTPKDAELVLKKIVGEFFADGKSRFINFSTGAGKTQTLIKVLEEMDPSSKILYLVKTHELAEQIVSTFNTLRTERQSHRSFRERVQSKSRMIHLSGREALCENEVVKKTYATKGLSIPALQCSKDCPFEAVCAYTLQFNNPLGNIRVMMHNEYFNPPAMWFSGITSKGTPNKTQWTPDFIIIDEDIFQKEQDLKEDRNSRFASIRLLLDQHQTGKTLEQIVLSHRQTIINDGLDNILPRKPIFQNARQYLRDMQEWNRQRAAHSVLLDNLVKFAITEETSYLQGMRYESKPGKIDALIQSQIKPIAERHRGIPTLYLDATAHPNVIQRLLPQVEFHAIRVQSKPDIHLYQLCNATITQQDLRDETQRNRIIAGLKRLIQPYRNPGLITYMKVPGMSSSMDELLAQEIGVPLWGHFGALRGVNKFDEVDCLIVLGRYCLNLNEMESYAYAIFNRFNGMDRAYLDSPVRMKDGLVATLNSLIQTNSETRAIAEHFSLSETLQAIGRGRLVHGQPKDIYYLSNEYLGSDLEVSRFLTYDEVFPQQWITSEALEQLREVGFVQDKGKLAHALGITDTVLRKHRAQIERELSEEGFIPYQVNFKDTWRNRKSVRYFVADPAKLEKDLQQQACKEIDLQRLH